MRNTTQRLIVVSNRLPFVVKQDGDSQWQVEPGSGGLISALVPVLRQRGGTWIGWPGTDGPPSRDLDQVLHDVGAGCGYTLKAVHLTPGEVHDFYQGFSNEIIWPLFHDLQSVCNSTRRTGARTSRSIASTPRPWPPPPRTTTSSGCTTTT